MSPSLKRNNCILSYDVAVCILSYDVADIAVDEELYSSNLIKFSMFYVFQWIMSCHKKCYEHTCINTFAGICNVIDNVLITM